YWRDWSSDVCSSDLGTTAMCQFDDNQWRLALLAALGQRLFAALDAIAGLDFSPTLQNGGQVVDQRHNRQFRAPQRDIEIVRRGILSGRGKFRQVLITHCPDAGRAHRLEGEVKPL